MKSSSRQKTVLPIIRAIKAYRQESSAPKTRLESITAFLTSVRSIVTSLAILVLVFVLLWIGIQEFTAEYVLIEPFDVPQALEKQGLNGRVIANKLYNQINVIRDKAGPPTKRVEKTRFIPTWSDKKVDMQVPGTGISINSAISYIKGSFKKYEPTRVVGEIVTRQNKLQLTIRIKDMPAITIPGDLKTLDGMLEEAGKKVCRFTQPNLLAYYYYSIRDRENCTEVIQYMLSSSPKDDASAYTLRGLMESDDGDSAGAIAMYEKATKVDPKQADAYANWGNVLADQKEFKGAIEKYQKAIDLDPKYANAYANWGSVLIDQKEFKGAIEKYQKAIDLDPKFVDAYNGWGVALKEQGNLEGAIEKYERAIEIDPEYAYAFSNWGNVLIDQKDFKGAIEKYQKATEFNPKYADAYYNWAIALKEQNNLNGAIEKYKKAIEIDPKYANAYYNWGVLLADEKKDFNGAIAKYKKAIEFNPKDSRHNNLTIFMVSVMKGYAG